VRSFRPITIRTTFKFFNTMRTTLDIDDDVLAAANEISQLQGVSPGVVVSTLLRQALGGGIADAQQVESAQMHRPSAATAANAAGFRPFASGGRLVSNGQIDALRDAEGV
jgi:Arc/MetJ family transcription regulator